MKRLCIIHTTPATIVSLKPLAKEILGNIELYNFLDDSILPEINLNGKITDFVIERVVNMMKSAALIKPDTILFACSTIGELSTIASNFTDIPVKRIDEPMCALAVEKGVKIGVAATLKSTILPTCNLLEKIALENGKKIEIVKLLIDGANSLLNESKGDEYDTMVSNALQTLKLESDIVVLAQASMARALTKIDNGKENYLTSPISGLESLKCIQ